MKRPRFSLLMPTVAIALASLLAACSSGTTGMLPVNPQTQSRTQAPNRATGSASIAGSGLTAPATVGTTHNSAGSPAPLPGGTISKATPQFTEYGPPPPSPTGGGSGGSGGTGGSGCNSNPVGYIATPMNPMDIAAPSPCGGSGSGAPCASSMNPTPCVAYGGKPQDGKQCNGSQYKIGSPISPANENSSNTGYYVNNISAITQNGLPAAYVYQVNEANSTTNYYFIQITNNATNQFTVGLGISFGPVNISLSDTYGVSAVSAPQWFFPGQTPLPSNTVSISCWPQYPMPS